MTSRSRAGKLAGLGLAVFSLAAFSLSGWASPASATVRIEASAGGRIGDYLALFAAVRQSGENVVIDGPCLSACTLVLSVVPRSRICVTRRAILGFHAAWTPGRRGKEITHAGGTRLMYATYPGPVKAWIRRHGGLTRKTLLLHGSELNALYRSCGGRSARSR
ncbi:MAG: hypothetical protein AB7O60_19050 [Variibacter sp.]